MKIIYLMGAGRSGTTMLATLLGNAPGIQTLGEMHQFLDYYLEDKPLSNGELLSESEFWAPVVAQMEARFTREELVRWNKLRDKVEGHGHIPASLLSSNKKYQEFQRALFDIIDQVHQSPAVLDSAKYISRALQLARMDKKRVKIIYVVRDVRGVIYSFGKNVQTPKKPLAAMVYYSLINKLGLLTQWVLGAKQVMRLRYESVVEQPEQSLARIQEFIGVDLTSVNEKLSKNQAFDMPPIVAGNRMAAAKQIRLNPDFSWKREQSRGAQILYYLLNLPLQLIFKYRL